MLTTQQTEHKSKLSGMTATTAGGNSIRLVD
uniref:Uncharacterized protein n=1 Tax=Ciona intestinalis TaxID=7719 RepID=H2XVC2_CIOIN